MLLATKIFSILGVAVHGAEIVFGSGQGETKKQFATTLIETSLGALTQGNMQIPNLKSPEANAALGVLINSSVDYLNKTGVLTKLG